MADQRSPYDPDARAERNGPYKFTPEEMRLLQRCNKESFYQRSLPISTILGLGTYWCVKSGYLRANQKWGASVKVAGAVVIGYFIGKISYHQRCAEYFMALPNSEVGETLRRRRGERSGSGPLGGFQDSVTDGLGISPMPPFGGLPSTDVYSDLSDGHRYTDLDTDRPLNEGLNDSFRPSVDYQALEEDIIPQQAPDHIVTYEELRKRNRDDYSSRSSSYRPYTRSQPQPDESPSFYRPPSTPPENRPKNLYGDVWEK